MFGDQVKQINNHLEGFLSLASPIKPVRSVLREEEKQQTVFGISQRAIRSLRP